MKVPSFFVLGLLTLSGVPIHAQIADVTALQAKAAKGDAEAELDLGRDYHLGTGVAQDYAKAMVLYRQAADQGNAKAAYNLGYMHVHGQGMTVDVVGSGKWFQKASDLGLPAAQLQMGLYYLRGQGGFSQDYGQALKLLTLAYNGCDRPEQKVVAASSLSSLYANGWGVPKDPQKMLEWNLAAADLEDSRAQFGVGCNYFFGAGGTKRDLIQAYKWIKLSAYQGNFMATHMLSENLHGTTFTPQIMVEGTRLANEFLKAHGEDPIPDNFQLSASQASAEALILNPGAFSPGAGSPPAQSHAAATNAPTVNSAPSAH